MNIGYVWQREDVDLDSSTGPVLHVRAVIEGLRRRGHRVCLVTFRRGRPAWTADLVEWRPLAPRSTGAPWFRAPERALRGVQSRLDLPYVRLFESARFADAALPALRGCDILYERFDVLASGGLMAGWRLGVPVVLELNGDMVEEYLELGIELPSLHWAALTAATRRIFRRADHLVAVSEPLRRATIARWGIDAGKVSAVPNGVDLERFSRPAPDRRGANAARAVMHVGSFQPWHSLDLLVDAFAQVAGAVSAQLILVGDGGLRAEIEAQVRRQRLDHRVHFVGAVPHHEVACWLGQADIAVLAHRPTTAAASGTPLKLLEYMAAGKAIVAPALPNIAAVVRDGETARLFEPGDASSLAAALIELLADGALRTRLGEAARSAALAGHSWDAAVIRLEQVFQTLAPRLSPA